MLVRAKAAVSDKKRIAMTPMAHNDMMAPNVVAYCEGKENKIEVRRMDQRRHVVEGS